MQPRAESGHDFELVPRVKSCQTKPMVGTSQRAVNDGVLDILTISQELTVTRLCSLMVKDISTSIGSCRFDSKNNFFVFCLHANTVTTSTI